MAVTINVDGFESGRRGQNTVERIGRNLGIVTGTITFDTAYSFGGELISGSTVTDSNSKVTGLENFFYNAQTGSPILSMVISDNPSGLSFQLDRSSKGSEKLKVFAPAPAIVYNEKHTIAGNEITLDYPPALLMNLASGTAHQIVTDFDSSEVTLGTAECRFTAAPTWGNRSTIIFHSSTSGEITCTYVTQAWYDAWQNRARETDSTSTNVTSLSDVWVAIESIHGNHASTDVNSFGYTRGGDASGTGECEIDFTDAGNSNLTTLTFAAGDSITGTIVTGIKKPSSGFLSDRFIEDQDNTIASSASAANLPANPILFQSTCGQIPDFTAAAERDPHTLQMPFTDALGTTAEFSINYQQTPGVGITSHITLNDSTSDAVSLTYINGSTNEIPGLVPLEVKDAVDLSTFGALRFYALGYIR